MWHMIEGKNEICSLKKEESLIEDYIFENK